MRQLWDGGGWGLCAAQCQMSYPAVALCVAVHQLFHPRSVCISVSDKLSLCGIMGGCFQAALPQRWLHLNAGHYYPAVALSVAVPQLPHSRGGCFSALGLPVLLGCISGDFITSLIKA